jgi:hypothetical protein
MFCTRVERTDGCRAAKKARPRDNRVCDICERSTDVVHCTGPCGACSFAPPPRVCSVGVRAPSSAHPTLGVLCSEGGSEPGRLRFGVVSSTVRENPVQIYSGDLMLPPPHPPPTTTHTTHTHARTVARTHARTCMAGTAFHPYCIGLSGHSTDEVSVGARSWSFPFSLPVCYEGFSDPCVHLVDNEVFQLACLLKSFYCSLPIELFLLACLFWKDSFSFSCC